MDQAKGVAGGAFLLLALVAVLAGPSVQLRGEGPTSVPDGVASPNVDEAVATHPFVNEKLTLRMQPSPSELGGDQVEVTAYALTKAPCSSEQDQLVLVPAGPGDVSTATVEPRSGKPDIAGCAVTVTGTLPVDAVNGSVVPAEPTSRADGSTAIPYGVVRLPHRGSLGIVVGAAAVMAVFGTLYLGSWSLGKNAKARRLESSAFAFPVLGAITGAGTSVVAVTAILTDVVPGLQLGWVLLLGLVAGVCVVGGKAIGTGVPLGVEATLKDGRPQAVSSRKNDLNASGLLSLGVAVSLFGIYLTALLNPLVLLHGVRWNACLVAVGAVVLLLIATLLGSPPTGGWGEGVRALRRLLVRRTGSQASAPPAHEDVHHDPLVDDAGRCADNERANRHA